MSKTEKESFNHLFNNSLEPYPGLSIGDLNRYLSAVRKVDDISMTKDTMEEGLFLADALEGLMRLPDNSIDLIITQPPKSLWRSRDSHTQKMTLNEYVEWNRKWLSESQRVMKKSGAIYLMCGWHYSGMYHSLLSDFFRVQTRITCRNRNMETQGRSSTWQNEISDIWFATKTTDFIFNKETIVNEENVGGSKNMNELTNFWFEYFPVDSAHSINYQPEMLLNKILEASSFKLNWVADPFMKSGSVGVASKNAGRRFIGFETDQDSLLLAMKRIDNA